MSSTIPASEPVAWLRPWLARVSLVVVASVLCGVIFYRVLETPFWSFNGARLMPSFDVSRGFNYYVLPHTGPVHGAIYGPATAIVYLPATLMKTPNDAVIAGSIISALLCFSAAAFLHFAGSGNLLHDRGAFFAAALLLCYLEPLRYVSFNIHADTPGLAFGSLGCGTLFYLASHSRRWVLPVSAFFGVLAIFCKQVFLPVPVTLLIYVLFVQGRSVAVRYALWLGVAAAVLGSVAVFVAGPARLYYSTIWVPGHHAWGAASAMVQSLRYWIRISLPVLLPLLTAWACLLSTRGIDRRSLRSLAAHRCVPVQFVGLALLPSSIAGRSKIGGDINSFSFSLFFLTCGLTLLLADTIAVASITAVRRLAACTLVAIILPLAISEAPLLLDLRSRLRQLPMSGQNVAYEYLRRHPGQAWFPWLPLSHFYAEHRLFHLAAGIGDRLLAGEVITNADFRAYIPQNPRLIAFSEDGTRDAYGYDLLKYLPEYHIHADDPELPGWTLYFKSETRQR